MIDYRAYSEFVRDLQEVETDLREVRLYHDNPPTYQVCYCKTTWQDRTARTKRAVRLMAVHGYGFKAWDQLTGRCEGCEVFKCYQKL